MKADKPTIEFKQAYSISEIEPIDDMILIKLPKVEEKIGRIIVSDKAAKEEALNKYCEVLKLGHLWDVQYPETAFTSIKVGDNIIVNSVMAFSVKDFDYPNSVALIYRSDIRFKVPKQDKIIS